MYGQIIRFIIVVFLYVVKPADTKPFMNPWLSVLLFSLQFGLFYLLCKVVFVRHTRRTISPSVEDYFRTEVLLGIISIPFFAFVTYGIDIKYFLSFIPGFKASMTISNAFAFLLYFTYLCLIWFSGYEFFCKAFHTNVSIRNHLRNQIRFYSGFVIPWLVLSFFSDIVNYALPWKFFKTEGGHLISTILGFVIFSFFGVGFIVKTWQCKPLPRGPKRDLIERFLKAHQFSVRDILLWTPLASERDLTAGIMGFLPRFRYILITPALLEVLSDEELLSVIAHEMGHIRKFHMPFYLAFFTGYILIVYAFSDFVILWVLSREKLISLAATSDFFSVTVLALLTTIPFLIFLLVYFRFIFGYFSRNCERQADLYTLELLGTPLPLTNSLRKIAVLSGNVGNKRNWHHYSIIERIEFIQEAGYNPSVGEAHNKKLATKMKIWFLVVVLLVICGLAIKKSSWFERAMLDTNLKVVATAVNQSFWDPRFYAAYGGYLIEKGSYEYAEKVLTRGLLLFKDDPEILNTLAWLYATAPPPLRNPARAVELAEKATKLSPESAHIWDTLAEAYYSYGSYEKALEAINKAIDLNSPPKDYYLKQREKIQRRLIKKSS
ncbi:MAG: M48 family metalloprotease [Thermodesulforhabdaceae bacterium]